MDSHFIWGPSYSKLVCWPKFTCNYYFFKFLLTQLYGDLLFLPSFVKSDTVLCPVYPLQELVYIVAFNLSNLMGSKKVLIFQINNLFSCFYSNRDIHCTFLHPKQKRKSTTQLYKNNHTMTEKVRIGMTIIHVKKKLKHHRFYVNTYQNLN